MNACPTPSPEMAFGSHKFKVNKDTATCANCGLVQTLVKEPPLHIPRDWKSATAGYTFAEDLNADGSLPTDDAS